MTRLQTCLLAAALLLPADGFKVAPAPAGETPPWAEVEGRQLSEGTSCDVVATSASPSPPSLLQRIGGFPPPLRRQHDAVRAGANGRLGVDASNAPGLSDTSGWTPRRRWRTAARTPS